MKKKIDCLIGMIFIAGILLCAICSIPAMITHEQDMVNASLAGCVMVSISLMYANCCYEVNTDD